MIYGDEPKKIREYKDPLGLNAYTYAPDIYAVRQSTNLYAYCVNNPIRFQDSSGEFIALPVLFKAAGILLGALGVGWASDEIGTIITDEGFVFEHGYLPPSTIPSLQTINISRSQAKSVVKILTKPGNDNPTIVYRLGSGNGTNLTPRPIDQGGLSYQLNMPSAGQEFTMTTMEAINATGALVAIKDGSNHVSVTPTDPTEMQSWIDSRPTAIENPHRLTTLLRSISIKVGKN